MKKITSTLLIILNVQFCFGSDEVSLEMLQKIEANWGKLFCGNGILDTMRSQARAAIGDLPIAPYLIFIAERNFSEESNPIYPELAVGILGTIDSEIAIPNLKDLHDRGIQKWLSAKILAQEFLDPYGLDILVENLASSDLNVKAQSLASVAPFLSTENVHWIEVCARDPHHYSLSAFHYIFWRIPEKKALVAEHLEKLLDEHQNEFRKNFAMILFLFGDDTKASYLEPHVLEYKGPLTNEGLTEHSNWCKTLAERGFKTGLDGAANLIDLWENVEYQYEYWHAAKLIVRNAPYPRSPSENMELGMSFETAKKVKDWWRRNRDDLEFDPKGRSYRRIHVEF